MPDITWIRTLSDGSQVLYVISNRTNVNPIIIQELDNFLISSVFSINATTSRDTANYSCKATNRLETSISTSSVYIFCKL